MRNSDNIFNMKNSTFSFLKLSLICLLFSATQIINAQNIAGVVGHIFIDDNDNCLYDAPDEVLLSGWKVQAVETTTGVLFETASINGFYQFDSLGLVEGVYEISMIPLINVPVVCPNSFIVDINFLNFEVDTIDFSVPSITMECPHYMFVDIGAPFLRPCFENDYTLQYCNAGMETEDDVYIEVVFDGLNVPLTATPMWTSVDGDTYTFNIGTVESGTCGIIDITTFLDCDAVVGLTHCVEAHIYPDEICADPNPSWNGASLNVTGRCQNDEVIFTIENVGDNDMTAPSSLIVIEDHVVMMTGEVPVLLSGESTEIIKSANGSTYRIEVDQVPFHPGNSAPSAWVEACTIGASFSLGFVTQFTENDDDPFISIHCIESVAAYDPNEKHAFPKGFGEENLIERNTDLDYVIHFQNLGTASAVNIVVLDTLSDQLNKSTVRPGASSHPYTFSILPDNVLSFSFENINLPEASANEPASHGFVKFRISQQPDLPNGTLIHNDAAIFFDFNDPIITNQTTLKIGEDFIEILDAVNSVEFPNLQMKVYPNPFENVAQFELSGIEAGTVSLSVYDRTGQLIRQESHASNSFDFHQNDLPTGMYFYKLERNGILMNSGKLMVK